MVLKFYRFLAEALVLRLLNETECISRMSGFVSGFAAPMHKHGKSEVFQGWLLLHQFRHLQRKIGALFSDSNFCF